MLLRLLDAAKTLAQNKVERFAKSGVNGSMTAYTIQQLLQEYVFQRQQKVPPNSALQLLARMEPNLPQDKRRILAQWIRQWELEREQQQQHVATPVSLPQAAPPPNPTYAPELFPCKSCGAMNPDNGKYCFSCGELLNVLPERGTTEQLELNEPDPAMFGKLSSLLIAVRGHDQQPLRIQVKDHPMVVGRSDSTRPGKPDIDLAPFDAKRLGVSRTHAVLKRQENTITLTDQGSVNNTYINGEKIHPHEVRVIRDGDEIRFGKLITHVTFYRELRRLS
jgi:hypothetical protein